MDEWGEMRPGGAPWDRPSDSKTAMELLDARVQKAVEAARLELEEERRREQPPVDFYDAACYAFDRWLRRTGIHYPPKKLEAIRSGFISGFIDGSHEGSRQAERAAEVRRARRDP